MFVSYRPQVAVAKMVQYLKGTSSRILLQEFAQLRKQFWDRHLWARGYMAISSGNITDEMIQKYIEEQEGEIVDDGRFQIELKLITPRLQGEGVAPLNVENERQALLALSR